MSCSIWFHVCGNVVSTSWGAYFLGNPFLCKLDRFTKYWIGWIGWVYPLWRVSLCDGTWNDWSKKMCNKETSWDVKMMTKQGTAYDRTEIVAHYHGREVEL